MARKCGLVDGGKSGESLGLSSEISRLLYSQCSLGSMFPDQDVGSHLLVWTHACGSCHAPHRDGDGLSPPGTSIPKSTLPSINCLGCGVLPQQQKSGKTREESKSQKEGTDANFIKNLLLTWEQPRDFESAGRGLRRAGNSARCFP